MQDAPERVHGKLGLSFRMDTILRQRAWCKSGARDRQRSGAIRRAAARMDHARGGPLYRKVAFPSIDPGRRSRAWGRPATVGQKPAFRREAAEPGTVATTANVVLCA